jgi:hypothetical protein
MLAATLSMDKILQNFGIGTVIMIIKVMLWLVSLIIQMLTFSYKQEFHIILVEIVVMLMFFLLRLIILAMYL